MEESKVTQSETKSVVSYVFFDEVEDIPATVDKAGQWIFYIGVGIPAAIVGQVNTKVLALLDKLPNKTFHAKDIYKEKSSNLEFMREMSQVIFSYNLPCFCFPFAKSMLEDPNFKVLKEIKFNLQEFESDPWRPKITNYKFVGYYLLIHCLNWYLPLHSTLSPYYELVFHQGIRDSGNGFNYDDSSILSSISKTCFANLNKVPLLALADHLNYLFGKCRRELVDDHGSIIVAPSCADNYLANECLKHLAFLSLKGQYHLIDLIEWKKYENNRLDNLNKSDQ